MYPERKEQSMTGGIKEMTKKEAKEKAEMIMLHNLVISYNGRLKAHMHERELLMKEHDWLKKKLDKAFAKAEKEEGNEGE